MGKLNPPKLRIFGPGKSLKKKGGPHIKPPEPLTKGAHLNLS